MSHIHGFILLITSLIEEMVRITQLYLSREPIIKVFYWSRFMSFGKNMDMEIAVIQCQSETYGKHNF